MTLEHYVEVRTEIRQYGRDLQQKVTARKQLTAVGDLPKGSPARKEWLKEEHRLRKGLLGLQAKAQQQMARSPTHFVAGYLCVEEITRQLTPEYLERRDSLTTYLAEHVGEFRRCFEESDRRVLETAGFLDDAIDANEIKNVIPLAGEMSVSRSKFYGILFSEELVTGKFMSSEPLVLRIMHAVPTGTDYSQRKIPPIECRMDELIKAGLLKKGALEVIPRFEYDGPVLEKPGDSLGDINEDSSIEESPLDL